MSDARRTRGALERIAGRRRPTSACCMRQTNLGFLLARIGFGDDPHPSHVEATRQMLAGVLARDAARRGRARCSRSTSPTSCRTSTLPTLVLVRHRRRAHAARGRARGSPS